MLPQIICRYTTILSISPNLAKKKYFNVCDFEKKWCFACKADFWNDPYFYMNAEPYFKSYFCRPYKDALPVLVTLLHFAKIFFNVRDLDKNSVLSPILTFGTAPILLIWTVTPCFYFCFSQIICIYIAYLSDTKISSTEVTIIFANVSNFSDFPLHSMQKCRKAVVLLDRPPFVPSAGDISVFITFFLKLCNWMIHCFNVRKFSSTEFSEKNWSRPP